MSQLELAWAAGLFEGEGYIGIQSRAGERKYKSNYWYIGIGMTDEDVIKRFADLFNLNYTTRVRANEKSSKNYFKDLYVVRTSKRAKVKEIVDALLPFMGERRRSKMEEFLGDFKAQCS